MEYRPGLPETNDNVSEDHPLKDFGIMLVVLASLLILLYLVLGWAVDFTVARISPEKEFRWFNGSALAQTLHQTVADGEEHTFEFDQFEELKACAGIDVPITIHANTADTINAVAIPGGSIIVFDGLLKHLPSENGLAFVLAHELAHFKHRDHLKGMGRGIVFIAIVATITGGNTSFTNAVVTFLGLGQARYSQSRESAADILALDTLNCLYGHVGGATEFFESVRDSEQSDVFLGSHYFSTHPHVGDRIADIEDLIQEKGYLERETRLRLQ